MQTLKRWIIREPAKYDNSKLKKINDYVLAILNNRGINDEEGIERFISPKIEDLYDPYLLPDMAPAVDMIKDYVYSRKKIVIYGDYDTDGITSTSILLNFFRKIGVNIDYYIPDRMDEGYGLNTEAIDNIIKGGAQLIITVDCGITSLSEVSYCKNKGVDIIITDHHECKDKIPKTIVIDAKRPDSDYPFRELSGAGIALKLVIALKKVFKNVDPINYIDLAAIGTVADIVPLIDENRIIVKYGIEKIKSSHNPGILSLIDVCGIDKDNISSGNIGFTIAPRINASGRIANASSGVKLFTCIDNDEAAKLAVTLDEDNKKRQEIEEKILSEAEKQIEDNFDPKRDLVMVLNSPSWHVGVIGIVASRLVEKYYRPVIMLSGSEGTLRGSARSIKSFDIFKSLMSCSDLLEKFGGHEMAAGLSIVSRNLEAFREKINNIARDVLTPEDMIPSIYGDCKIRGEDITVEMADGLKMLEPYGSGNPAPLFVLYCTVIEDIKTVGNQDKHLKLRLSAGTKTFNAVAFNMGYNINGYFRNDKIDILFSLSVDTWNGRDNVQLVIKDMKHSIFPKIEHDYFRSLKRTMQCLMESSGFEMNYDSLPFDSHCREKVLGGFAPQKSLILVSSEDIIKDILNAGVYYNVHLEDAAVDGNNLPQLIINPDFSRIRLGDFDNVYIMDYLTLFGFLYNAKRLTDETALHNCCGAPDDDISFIKSLMPSGEKEEKIFSYLSGISKNGYAKCSVRTIADALSLKLICVYYNLKSMMEEGTLKISGLKDDVIIFRINFLRENSTAETRCSKGFAAAISNLDRFRIPDHNKVKGE